MLHYSFILQKPTVHLLFTNFSQPPSRQEDPCQVLISRKCFPSLPSPWDQMVPCLGQPFSSPSWLVAETTQSLRLCFVRKIFNPQNHCHSTGLYPAPPNFVPPKRAVSRLWCELLWWSQKEITTTCHIEQQSSKLTAGEEEGVKWGIGKHQKKWGLLIPTFGKGTLLEMVWWHNA